MTQKIKNYDELYQEAASHAFSLCGIPGEVMPVQEAISRKFAELVRNAALEEAAVACDNLEFEDKRQPYDAWTVGTMDCADKIRSLATTEVQMCACKDRPASHCPGEWEPNCDLGNNEQFAVPAERSSVFRYIDQQVQKEMAGFYDALGIPEPSTQKQNLEVVGEVVECNDNGHPWKRISGLDWQLDHLPVGKKVYTFFPSE